MYTYICKYFDPHTHNILSYIADMGVCMYIFPTYSISHTVFKKYIKLYRQL